MASAYLEGTNNNDNDNDNNDNNSHNKSPNSNHSNALLTIITITQRNINIIIGGRPWQARRSKGTANLRIKETNTT